MRKKKAGSSQNRSKMVDNNVIAREMLIKAGYTDIWLKQHTRYLDWVWARGEHAADGFRIIKYQAQDIWNLFDGICWYRGSVVFLAIGRKFKKEMEILSFLRDKKNVTVLMIKVDIHKKTSVKCWSV